MADMGFDGMVAVVFAPVVADITAPKAATEINAAGSVVLHTRLTPDGLKTPASTSNIDNSKMVSTFTTEQVGRRDFKGLQIKYVRGDAVNEQLLDSTLVYKASGFLIVRRNLAATAAFAAAQKVEVYPVTCEEPAYADVAPNALQTVTVTFAVTFDPRSPSNPATVAA